MEQQIDGIQLNFSEDSLLVLNICLAIIMFGIALNLRFQDFKNLIDAPKPAIVGILSQFLVLPALTFVLVWVIEPMPSMALGMILVAACPGGNISNFMTHYAGGDTALSISLTAFATVVCIFATPFNLAFWGSLYGPTSAILKTVSVSPMQLFETIVLILALPLITGMLLAFYFQRIAEKLQKILKPLSMLIFVGFVVGAFLKNTDNFMSYFQFVVGIVFVHNALALMTGYGLSTLFRLSQEQRKSITIETGIQNSGLGLLLIFTYFNGLGGMAIVAAWWGIWHIISGLLLGTYWSRKWTFQSPLF